MKSQPSRWIFVLAVVISTFVSVTAQKRTARVASDAVKEQTGITVPVAATPGLYGSRAGGFPGELYRLDPATGGVIQDIGPLNDSSGGNYPITALAFRPATGVLYGAIGGSSAAATLVSIDPTTALVTPIGDFNIGQNITDMAFSTTDVLYGVGSLNPNIFQINITTGEIGRA